MLSDQQLKDISIKTQTSVLNIAREYIQNLFLKYFYSFEESESVLFKGGTALRILYRSPRFSEDLDFSAVSINKNTIEDLLQETILKLDYERIQIEIKESTPTSGGFLAILNSQFGNNNFDISLEVSSRKKKLKSQLLLVDNIYIDAYSIISLEKEELIAEKVEALLNRKKPRDFFDLYFMLRANLLPEKNVLKKIFPLIKETKIDFKKELQEFLPVSYHRIIKEFKKHLEAEVKRFV